MLYVVLHTGVFAFSPAPQLSVSCTQTDATLSVPVGNWGSGQFEIQVAGQVEFLLPTNGGR